MDIINQLDIELSSLCNAACPCCPRFQSNSPIINEHLYLDYITIDKFKEWFPKSILDRVKHLKLCGNHGDLGTNPDLIEIFKYLSNFNFKKLSFNTNGGMKTPLFWKELAEVCNTFKFKTNPIFSIDGLEDTNHIYRRNVNWKKLLKNVKSFNNTIKNENVEIVWDFLVFKHNEHQLDEVKKLSRKLKFNLVKFKLPINLDDGENILPISVLDKKGNLDYWIYPSDLPEFKPSYLSDTPNKVYKSIPLFKDIGEDDKGLTDEDFKTISELKNLKIKPKCSKNDLYVESNGDVYRCCFITNGIYKYKTHYLNKKYVPIKHKQLFDSISNIGFEKFNLNYNTLENIFSNNLLNKIYNNKWNSKFESGKLLQCSEICGKSNSLDIVYGNKKEKQFI